MIAFHPLSVLLLAAGIDARSLSFETKSVEFSDYKGLYQSTYDTQNNRIFLTNSIGRPPVNQSNLLVVDPETLAVVKETVPEIGTAPGKTGANITQRYAVYGIAFDEKNDRVWTTNTRQDTVSYYDAKDLSLVHRYPILLPKHARDVYVDPKTSFAWVSASTSDNVDVFDANKPDSYTRRINVTEAVGRSFPNVMSLVADEANRVVYTVSLKSPLAAAINMDDYSVKVFDLGENVQRSSGVAWDSKRQQLFVANQGSNNTVVLDTKSGKVVKSVDLPGGPLNARYDPVFDVVYVACRSGHAVVVIDPEDFSIITQLNVPIPNHIEVAPNGDVYVTDKSPKSLFYKFTPKNDSSDAGHSHDHSTHVHAGHDHSGHDHAGHDHSGHDHAGHDHAGHDHSAHGAGDSAAAKGSSDAKDSDAKGRGATNDAATASGAKGSNPAVVNAASILQAPLAIGAIAAVALLV